MASRVTVAGAVWHSARVRAGWLFLAALGTAAVGCGSDAGVERGASLMITDPTAVGVTTSAPGTGGAGTTTSSTDPSATDPTTESTGSTPPPTDDTTGTDSTPPDATTTTDAPVTTGPDGLPILAPDQQPATADEARALLGVAPTAALPPDFAHYPDFFDITLRQVANGTVHPDDFFNEIAVQITAGVIANPYLVCPIELGDACTASPNDIQPYFDDCRLADGRALATTVVESGPRWAGAAVCIWIPTPDALEEAENLVLGATILDLADRNASVVYDATVEEIAGAMALAVATVPDLTAGEPEYEEFYARLDQLTALSPSGKAAYTNIEFVTPTIVAGLDDVPTQVKDQIDAFTDVSFEGGVQLPIGVGSYVARGRLTVYVAWYDPT